MPADETPQQQPDEIERHIITFIRDEQLAGEIPVERDTELLSDGMLDSLGVMRLATFVDDEYRLDMQPAEFVIENFQTVAALAEYVRRARPGGDD